MKRIIKLSLLLLALLLPASALAYDFKVDGIYYDINDNEVSVTFMDIMDNYYQGDIAIPEMVTYNGITYSVTSIGEYAFINCYDLTSVSIPNSVTSIGPGAFQDCGLNSVVIPNSVTEIGSMAFCGCSGLTSVNIPNSVTEIGSMAFYGCSGLTSVDIPNSVTTIGDDAFYRCSGLTSIDIPNSVISIKRRAFEYCTGLKSINIGNSVTVMDWSVLHGCNELTSIVVASGNQHFDSRDNCNAIIETASNKLVIGCKSTVIPNSVNSVGAYAFYGRGGLTSVAIPDSVTSIGNYAFSGCSELTSVTIPNSVTSIGDYAFSECVHLINVFSYITDPSLATIGSSLFYLKTNYYSNRTLHVPAGLLAPYLAESRWGLYFGNIVEMEPEPYLQAESIHLNVTTAGLNEGATLQLTATVLPEEGTSKKMNWASSNPSIATVDSNGLVTTHGVGTATITAITTDGSNLSASCTVTLLPVSVKGDVNGDNNISIADVTALIDMLLAGDN